MLVLTGTEVAVAAFLGCLKAALSTPANCYPELYQPPRFVAVYSGCFISSQDVFI